MNFINKLITIILIFIALQSCKKQQNYYVGSPNEQKINLIDIDTVYKTITNNSIKIKIGFKDIPYDTIPFNFLRVEIVFDVNNDTSYKDDLSLGYLAFIPDNNIPSVNMKIEDILKTGAIKSLFKYSNLIDNGFYYILKDLHYSDNYLIISLSTFQ